MSNSQLLLLVHLVALAMVAGACKSPAPVAEPAAPRTAKQIPTPVPNPIEVEPVDWSSEAGGLCAEVDWGKAMTCEKAGCGTKVVGNQCSSCIDAASACVAKGRDCREQCEKCLGEERCAAANYNVVHASNVIAGEHIDSKRSVVHGPVVADQLMGAVGDGSIFAVGQKAKDNAFVVIEQTTMIDSAQRRLWALAHEYDDVSVSPDGHWLVVTSEDALQLYELATGFLRFQVPASEHAFGGDRYLIYGGEEGWRFSDLVAGEDAAVPWMERWSQPKSISPDGKRVVLALRDVEVFDIESGAAVFKASEHATDFGWEGPTILLTFDETTFRRFDINTKFLLDEIEIGTSAPARMVMTKRGPMFGHHDHHALYLRGLHTEEERYVPRGGAGAQPGYDKVVNGWKVLDDGRVAVGSTESGLTIFAEGQGEPDESDDSETSLGKIEWVTAGGKGEVLLGAVAGAFALELKSGERTRLQVPDDFQHVAIRGRKDRLAAVGEDAVWVGLRDGKDAVTVRGLESPTLAVLDSKGELHVATAKGLESYSLGEKPARLREISAQYVDISHDGAFALLAEADSMKVVRTSNYKLVMTAGKGTCAWAPRKNVIACAVESGERAGDVNIASYAIPKGKELMHGSGTMLNRGVYGVSDDGKQLLVGTTAFGRRNPDQLWDMEVGIKQLGGGRYTFTRDGSLVAARSQTIEVIPK